MDIVDVLTGFREGRVTQDFFMRAVLRHPGWQVPVDEHDHPLLWTLDGRDFLAAQSSPQSPDGSPTRWLACDGRHLVRHLPADCAGVVFGLGTPAASVIDLAESAPSLAHWVSVLDVEDALLNPQPGQADSLLDHQWYLLADATCGPLIEEVHPFLVAHVFSAGDRLRDFLAHRPAYRQSHIERRDGHALFAALSTRSDYDAIAVHYGLDSTELLGPRAAALFSEGIDGRSTARVMPARTIAEIHLFLDLEGASREDRTHQLEYLGEQLVARYTATVTGSRRTWWFEPVAATEDPQDLGAGPSPILCAGQLADLVRRRLRALPEDPAALDPDDRTAAGGAARWAGELEKMLDGAGLPRSAVRSPDGSRFLREIPQMATAAWIADARRRAQVLAQP